MRAAGLDIGSRTVELVVLEDGEVVSSEQTDTTPALEADCARLVSAARTDRLVVTGYGRTLGEVRFEAESVTEIKAYARGASHVHPGCRTVLDIGGQDMKVMSLDAAGRVLKFEMNDRCAAGAGKFLEMMAAALACPIDEFGALALGGEPRVRLSNMCAVFAESEAVGLLTKGEPREDIALAVHDAIARRAVALLARVLPAPSPSAAPATLRQAQGDDIASAGDKLVFAGGAARNSCLVSLLSASLRRPVLVPDGPQSIGALGAALLASER